MIEPGSATDPAQDRLAAVNQLGGGCGGQVTEPFGVWRQDSQERRDDV
jgi:hypothetical protein